MVKSMEGRVGGWWRGVCGPVGVAVSVMSLCAACATLSPAEEGDGDGEPDVAVASTEPLAAASDVSSVLGPGWQPFTFPGKRLTTYSASAVDGVAAVRADARRSASMLRCKVRVAPEDLGRIEFSWWVPGLIEQARLREPAKADSPVRVVMSFEGDRQRLSLRNQILSDLALTLTGEAMPYATLMYVWDPDAAPETVIPGARTDRVRKIVVDSGPHGLQSWRLHERDIVADFRRAFGEAPGALTGVALMSDSDNTRTDTHAFYGPIRLSGQGLPTPVMAAVPVPVPAVAQQQE